MFGPTGGQVLSSAITPARAPAAPASIGPRRPEALPNPLTIADQLSGWKLLVLIGAMSGIGSGFLLHLGRRDQRAMDAIHLDLMLGIERELPAHTPR